MKNIFISLFIILNFLASCKEEVEQTKPSKKDLKDFIFATGKLVSETEYTIPSMLDGNIKFFYLSEGDTVKSGQPVCQIGNELQLTQLENAEVNYNFSKKNTQENAPQIIKLKEQINQAISKCNTDSLNVIRYQKLFDKHAVSALDLERTKIEFLNSQTNRTLLQKSLEDLKAMVSLNESNAKSQLRIQEQNMKYSKVSIENDGAIILKIFKSKGDLIRKGEPICRVGSSKSILRLLIAAEDIKSILVNQSILIVSTIDRSKTYKGSITKIHPIFERLIIDLLVNKPDNVIDYM